MTADHEIITTHAALATLLGRVVQEETIYLDTETSGLHPHRGARICGVVVGFEDGYVCYVPLRHLTDEPQLDPAVFMAGFGRAIASGHKQLVFHNAKFDVAMFLADGVDLRRQATLHDTMIQSHLTDETRRRHALKLLGKDVLGLDDAADQQDYIKAKIAERGYDVDAYGYSQFPVWEMAPYACQDIVLTRALFHRFDWMIEQEDLHAVYAREQGVLDVVVDMERTGVMVDRAAIKRAIENLSAQIPGVYDRLLAHAAAAGVYFDPEHWEPIVQAAHAAWSEHAVPVEQIKVSRRKQKDGSIKVTETPVLVQPKPPPMDVLRPDLSYIGRTRLVSGSYSTVAPGDPFQSPVKINTIATRVGMKAAAQELGILKEGKRDLSSWDKTVLKALAAQFPFAYDLLEYRFLKKLLGTYFEPYLALTSDEYPFIHAEFNQIAALTGRFSSKNPNLHNLLRPDDDRDDAIEVKQVIIPRPGFAFVGRDYSSMEMVMLAELTGEESIIDALREGRDPHAERAKAIWQDFGNLCTGDPCEHEPKCKRTQKKLRSTAKTINFAILYGASPKKAGLTAGVGEAEGKQIVDRFFESMPRVKAYRNGIYRALNIKQDEGWWKQGQYGERRPTLRNQYGRVYHFPVQPLKEPREVVRYFNGQAVSKTEYFYVEGAHAALNYMDQGSCADLVKDAMIRVWEATRGSDARLVLQVHDELVLEVPVEEVMHWSAVLKRCMEEDTGLKKVQIKTDPWVAYQSWGTKEPLPDAVEVAAA